MTRDDKLLRETILAELKRRRNLLGKDDKPARSDPADHRRIARPIYPPSPPAPPTRVLLGAGSPAAPLGQRATLGGGA
jgi:hypothetical protein